MVNYRSTSDPITRTEPSASTVNWSEHPSDQPESQFRGSIYAGVDGAGSLQIITASSWLWRGTGLNDGSVLSGALGADFNHFNPAVANPPNVQILAHSQVVGGFSDVTYSATPGRGGVFARGPAGTIAPSVANTATFYG